MKTPDIKGALEAMKAASRGRRSPLHEWLSANYDALEAAFSTAQPSWNALADYLAKGGVMGGGGKPASPAAVRQAWLRIQADVARRRTRSPPHNPSLNPASQAAAPEPIESAAEYEEFDFNKFVKEKK
jgi:hypothetical protein